METPFLIVFCCFIAFFLFMVFTKRGKGLMFGGKIIKTFGDEIKSSRGIVSMRIKVHLIEKRKEPEPSIGIELSQNAKLSWSMTPINLSKNDARRLIAILNEAVN